MIGQNTTTRSRPPTVAPVVNTWGKGALREVEATTTASPKAHVYDDFSTPLSQNWKNVAGALQLSTGGGNLESSLFGIWYSAGYHKSQMLTDNHRATVTIGGVADGECRVVTCANPTFTSFYALEINRGIVTGNKFRLMKCHGPHPDLAVLLAEETVSVSVGNTAGLWYDRPNNTLKGLKNGAVVVSVPVPLSDVFHGPGYRYCGAELGLDWVFEPGCTFADFDAQDV